LNEPGVGTPNRWKRRYGKLIDEAAIKRGGLAAEERVQRVAQRFFATIFFLGCRLFGRC
jgi:hypothetical protein